MARLAPHRLVLAFAAGLLAAPAAAQEAPEWLHPEIKGFGAVTRIPGADARESYRVVFDIREDTPGDGRVNPGLARAARFVNLLTMSGHDPADSELVAVLHGDATSAAVEAEAYGERFGESNPNEALISRLTAAGVEVTVCGQALAAGGYDFERVLAPVSVTLSAMTRLAGAQMDGFALID
jgi:intracellular sulfur oxidation DsrE/DsrF family protein